MTDHPHEPDHDLDTVDLDDLFDELVLCDDASERQYLRTRWIERMLTQLVSLRAASGLTQRELGERIGKPQSSIARLEAASDIKLSVLWDYLSGIGLTPATPLPIHSLDQETETLRRYSANGKPGLPKMPKYAFHRSAVAKAREHIASQGSEQGAAATRAPETGKARAEAGDADKTVAAA